MFSEIWHSCVAPGYNSPHYYTGIKLHSTTTFSNLHIITYILLTIILISIAVLTTVLQYWLSLYFISLAGCPEAAINNVNRAVRCAIGQGALGILICNWSGRGHLTQQPFSWSGFVVGAGLGWNAECHLVSIFYLINCSSRRNYQHKKCVLSLTQIFLVQ